MVQNLDIPLPQMEDQLVASLGHLDKPIPEQVIEVPNIASSSQQIVDNPLPRGRGDLGGFQGFHTGQGSTVLSEQSVDIPVRSGGLPGSRPGQGSTASSSTHLHDDADEGIQGFFSHFSQSSKKVRGPASR